MVPVCNRAGSACADHRFTACIGSRRQSRPAEHARRLDRGAGARVRAASLIQIESIFSGVTGLSAGNPAYATRWLLNDTPGAVRHISVNLGSYPPRALGRGLGPRRGRGLSFSLNRQAAFEKALRTKTSTSRSRSKSRSTSTSGWGKGLKFTPMGLSSLIPSWPRVAGQGSRFIFRSRAG